jgi:tripartite-type tricarboxylate transporter receptor subunit TctC
MAEAGVAGYDVALWMGLAAPAGTPRDIVERLNRETSAVLALPEVKESLLQIGMVAEPGPSGDLAARIEGDIRKWRDVVNKAGIRER